jgi:excisionase family DNA binding protein
MPRTKPKPSPLTPPPAATNGLAGDVFTLREAAAYLRLPETEVVRLATTEGLPGRLIGREWRFFKTAIQQWLSASQPTLEMRQAAVLAMAGKFKDDPDLDLIVEDAMRRRGRQPGPDGTYGGYRPKDGGQD